MLSGLFILVSLSITTTHDYFISLSTGEVLVLVVIFLFHTLDAIVFENLFFSFVI